VVYYNVISTKFYNELRNGSAFNQNLGDFNNELTGNVGELVKVIIELEVEVNEIASSNNIINATQISIGITEFTFNGHWFNGGFSPNAQVDIIWNNGANIVTETIITSTGGAGKKLRLTNANLIASGFADGDYTDLEIRLKTTPDKLFYKYGLNGLNASLSYNSELDSNEQTYYGTINNYALTQLQELGQYKSWSLGVVQAQIKNVNGYVFYYVIEHTFRINYFTDVRLSNFLNNTTPNELAGTNTWRYDFGVYLSTLNFTTNINGDFIGSTGNVGWFNENFNGITSNYQVLSIDYTNSIGLNTLEATKLTVVSIVIKNNVGAFDVNQKAVVLHSKLPSSTDYSNKQDTYTNIWLLDTLVNTNGAPSVSGTIIQNLIVTINPLDNTELLIDFEVFFSATQQNLITSDDYFLLAVSLQDDTLTNFNLDRVNLVADVKKYNKDTDVYGLIQSQRLRFYKSDVNLDTINILNGTTDFNGWDSDFNGVKFEFELHKGKCAKVKSIVFRLLAYKSKDDYFEIDNLPLNINNNGVFNFCNFIDDNYNNVYLIPNNEDFNTVKITSDTPNVFWQKISGYFAFKVNWRDWILNSNVPIDFYDNTKPNNNLNKKTSNYSNVNGYNIIGVLDVEVSNNVDADTIYRIKSYNSDIYDFDLNPLQPISGNVTFYDQLNNVINNIYTNYDVRIEVEFEDLTFNFLNISDELIGEIIIEEDGTTLQEYRLNTVRDWYNVNSPIKSSIGNNKADIVITQNKVTLICNTDHLKIDENKNYNIYGRLWKKDPIIV